MERENNPPGKSDRPRDLDYMILSGRREYRTNRGVKRKNRRF